MRGTIRAKGRCVSCGDAWPKATLRCSCGRYPSRGIYIDLSWDKRPAKRRKIYSDRRGVPFRALEYAQSTLGRIRTEIDDGTFDPDNYASREQRELLWPNYCRAWEKRQTARAKRGDLAASSLRMYLSHLRTHIAPAPMLRTRDIREVRGSHLQEFQDWLDTKPLSATTKANVIGVLRLMFSDALGLDDIERRPKIPTARRPVPVHYRPTDAEREAILLHVAEHHRPIFRFLFEEPIREVEACRLRRTFLHLDAEPWIEIPEHIRKAGPGYSLPLTSNALAAVNTSPVRSVYLFSHRDGSPYTSDQLGKIWLAARKKAGVTRPTLYEATRHFIASRAANAGTDIGAIAAALGNTVAMTAKHYVTYKPEALRGVLGTGPEKAAPKRPHRGKA